MSEQTNQPNPELLQRMLLFADAYQKGSEQRRIMGINANADHEENVKNHWKEAITARFKQDVTTRTDRIDYRTTRTTYSLVMGDELRCSAIRFLASHFDWPLDQVLQRIKDCGDAAVQEKKRGGGKWGLLFIPIVGLFVLYAQLQKEPLGLPIVLLLTSLLILAVVLLSARSSKLRHTARKSEDTADVLEECCDVCAAGILKNVNRPILAVSLALVVGAGGYLFYRILPPSMDVRLANVLTGYNSSVPTKQLDELLLRNGTLSADNLEAIRKVRENNALDTEHLLQLDAYACQRIDAGYPEKEAVAALTARINALDLSKFNYSSNLKLLTDIMENVPWTFDPLFDRWLATAKATDDDMTAVIGGGLKNLPLEDKLGYAQRAQAGNMPYGTLLGGALSDEEIPLIRSMIDSETDPANLLFLSRIYGERETSPESIVPLLYLLRGQGLRLGDVFPDGVVVNMNLENLNLSHRNDDWEFQLPDTYKYLILSRIEDTEPLERKTMDPGNNYDGNKKSNPENFTVRIETAFMDRLPTLYQPATLDDCTMLIVADMSFAYDGSITRTTTTTRNSRVTSTSVTYYPTYARVYRLMMVERDGVKPQYTMDSKVINAENVSSTRTSNTYQLDIEIRNKYLAKSDNTWISSTLSTRLSQLEAADWNGIMFYITNIYTSDDSGDSNET